MNIPETAIEAVAESLHPGLFTLSDNHYAIRFDNPIEYRKLHQEAELEFAEFALQAALPEIEAALRKQIAAEISDAAMTLSSGSIAEVARSVQRQAARIAEKGTTK